LADGERAIFELYVGADEAGGGGLIEVLTAYENPPKSKEIS